MAPLLPSTNLPVSSLMGAPTVDQNDGTNWGDLLLLGNDIFGQWWDRAHGQTPQPTYIPGTGIPTQTYNNTLIALVVIAVVIAVATKR